MYSVVWTEQALANLEAIRAYLAQFNPQAASRVAVDLLATAEGLVAFPHRGRAVPGTGLREVVTAYPYVMRYRVDGRRVVILRIRHSARRPTVP